MDCWSCCFHLTHQSGYLCYKIENRISSGIRLNVHLVEWSKCETIWSSHIIPFSLIVFYVRANEIAFFYELKHISEAHQFIKSIKSTFKILSIPVFIFSIGCHVRRQWDPAYVRPRCLWTSRLLEESTQTQKLRSDGVVLPYTYTLYLSHWNAPSIYTFERNPFGSTA